MKLLQSIPFLLAVLLIGAQFQKPAAMRPRAWDRSHSLESQVAVPPEIQQTLRRACYDCHSNDTRWPWYSRVAPFSWMMASDVTEARQALNFSEWSARKPAVAASMLAAACSDVASGNMPKARYLLMHPEARLNAAEVRQFCDWTRNKVARITRSRRTTPGPLSMNRAELEINRPAAR